MKPQGNRKFSKRNSILRNATQGFFAETLEARVFLAANIKIDSPLQGQFTSFKNDIDMTLASTNGSTNLTDMLTPFLAASELPLIGSKLAQAIGFLTSVDSRINGALQSIVTDSSNFPTTALTTFDPTNVQTAVKNGLGSALAAAETSANMVRFFDATGRDITENTDAGGDVATRVQFNLDLTGTTSGAISSPFDIGFPGLSFNVNGSVVGDVTYTLFLHLGFDQTNGFYFDTNPVDQDSSANGAGGNGTLDPAVSAAEQPAGTPPPVLSFTAGISLKGSNGQPFNGTGTLGPLQLAVADHTSNGTQNGSDYFTHQTYNTPDLGADQKRPTGFNATVNVAFNNSGMTPILQLSTTPNVTISGTAIINLDTELSIGGDSSFPTLDSEFHLDWNLPAVSLATAPSGTDGLHTAAAPQVFFTDINVNIGTFLTNTIKPIIDSVYSIISPLAPLVYFLEKPMPIINDIPLLRDLFPMHNGKVTVADFLAAYTGESDIASFTDILSEIFQLESDLSNPPGATGTFINLGGFNLKDPRTISSLSHESVMSPTDPGLTNQAGGSFANALDSAYPGEKDGDILNDANPGASRPGGSGGLQFHLDFPLFENPTSVFGLFFGQNVDLFRFTASLTAGVLQYHQEVKILGPLVVDFHGSFPDNNVIQFTASLDIGYDTSGLTSSSHNPLDGLYANASDTFLSFGFGLAADAAIDIIIAEAGIGGGVLGNITLSLNSALATNGKVYFPALENAGLANIFQVSGELDAYLDAFYRVGLGPFSFGEDFHLASTTLLSFGPSAAAAPTLGTTDASGKLSINVDDIENQLPGDHDVRVDLASAGTDSSGNPLDDVIITASGSKTSGPVTQTIDDVSALSITGSSTDINQGSKITVGAGVDVPVTIVGKSRALGKDSITDEGLGLYNIKAGDGYDTISVSDGQDPANAVPSAGGTIQAGIGPDTINVSDYVPQGSSVKIYGGYALDTITVGEDVYADTIVGSASGNDRIDSGAYLTSISSYSAATPGDIFIVHSGVSAPGFFDDHSGGTTVLSPGAGATLEVIGAPFNNTFTISSSPLPSDTQNATITDLYTVPSYGNRGETYNTSGFTSVDLEGGQLGDSYNIGDLSATNLTNLFVDLQQTTGSHCSIKITAQATAHSFNLSDVSETSSVDGTKGTGGESALIVTPFAITPTQPAGTTIDMGDGTGDQVTFDEPMGVNNIYIINSAPVGALSIVNTFGTSNTGTDSILIEGNDSPLTINSAGRNMQVLVIPNSPISQPITLQNSPRDVNGLHVYDGTIGLAVSLVAGSYTLSDTQLTSDAMATISWSILNTFTTTLSGNGNTFTDNLTSGAGPNPFPVNIYAQGGGADSVYAGEAATPITFVANPASSGAEATGPELIEGTGLGDNITAGSGDDAIYEASSGTGAGDTIEGGGGNDLINAIGGNESIDGGNGDDTIYYQGVIYTGFYPTLAGGSGADTILCVGSPVIGDCYPVIYTDRADGSQTDQPTDLNFVEGDANGATIFGGSGRDTFELGNRTSTRPGGGTVPNSFGPTVIHFGTYYGYIDAGPAALTVYGGNIHDEIDSFNTAAPLDTPFLIASGTITDNSNGPGVGTGIANVDMTIAAGATVIAGGEYKTFGSLNIGSLAGAGNLAFQADGVTFITGLDNTSTIFTGQITGDGSFVKAGTGTFLCQVPQFTGTATAQSGTFRLIGNTNPPPAIYYTFNDPRDSSTTIYNQGTLTGDNAQIINAGSLVPVAGAPGGSKAFSLGSSATQLLLNQAVSLAGGAWTASLWFNTLNPPMQGYRTAFHSGVSNDAPALIQTGGYSLGSYLGSGFSGSGYSVNSANNVTTGWHQLTVVGAPTLPNPTTTFYIDGLPVSSINGESTADIASIGNKFSNPNEAFSNFISDVSIYQVALTSAQVQTLYQQYSPINNMPSSVIVASGATFDVNSLTAYIGSLSGGGNVTLGNGILTTGTDNKNTTFSGVISNAGSVTKTGSGTWTVSGVSTYTGATTLGGGVVNFNALPALGAGTAITFTGGTLQYATGNTTDISVRTVAINSGGATIDTNGNSVTLANAIGNGGVGTFTKTGLGTLTFSATGTWTGATTINGGTIKAAAINVLPVANDLTVGSAGTFDLNNFNQSAGSLSGAGNVTMGSATLTDGTGGNIRSTTFSGSISGSGSVVKTGASVLTLSGSSNYTGGTKLNEESFNNTGIYGISVSADSNLGAPASVLIFTSAGGALFVTSSFSMTRSIQLFSDVSTQNFDYINVAAGQTLTANGVISNNILTTNTPPLDKVGAGTLLLNAVNTFGAADASTDLIISGGTVKIGVAKALGNITVGLSTSYPNTGVFDLNGINLTIGALLGGFTGGAQLGNVTNSSASLATLTLDGNGFNNEYDGSITGPIALVLTNTINNLGGPATGLTHTASNYSGGTTLLASSMFGAFLSTLSGSTIVNGPFGTGPITVGSSSGSGTSALELYSGADEYNPITLVAGNTGTDKLTSFGASGNTFGGPVTLSHDVTLGGGIFSGGITGTGNVTIDNSAASQPLTFQPTTFPISVRYVGSTSIAAGSAVSISLNNALPVTTALTLLSGVPVSSLSLNNFNQTFASVSAPTGGDARHEAINLGSGTLTVGGDNTNTTYGGAILGTGSVIKNGSGIWTLTGGNTYTGTTQINSGAVVIGNNGTSGALVSSVVLANTASVTFARSDTYIYTGLISGNGSLTQAGSGTLIMIPPTQSGTTNVASGTLKLVNNPIPSAAVVYTFNNAGDSGTTVINTGSLGTAKNGTLSNAIETSGVAGAPGGGKVMKVTSTTLGELLIPQTAGKGVDFSGGSWTASAWFNGILPSSANRTLFHSSNNDAQAGVAQGGYVLSTYINGVFPSSYSIDGSGSPPVNITTGWHQITAVGSGGITTFYADGSPVGSVAGEDTTDLQAVDNYQFNAQSEVFATYIAQVYVYQTALLPSQVASLYLTSQGLPLAPVSLTMPSTVSVASGSTFDINSLNVSVGSISGAGSVLLGSGNLTTGSDNTSTTLSATISGTGGLVKTGTGTFTLTGVNTYTGPTNVNAGTVTVAQGTLATLPTPAVLYTFNNAADTGNTVTNSGTLANRNATLSNASEVSGIAGAPGGGKVFAMSSTGGELLVNLVNGKGVDISGGAWTTSLWFNSLYSNSASSDGYRTAFHSAATFDAQGILNSNGTLGSYIINGYVGSAYNASPVATGWHQLLIEGSAGSTFYYIDGALVGSIASESVSDIYSFGNYSGNTGEPFAKYLADIDVYTSALSQAQIISLYDQQGGFSAIDGSLASAAVTVATGAVLNINDSTGLSPAVSLVSNGTTTFAANSKSSVLVRNLGSVVIGSSGSVVVKSAANYSARTDIVAGGLTFSGSILAGWSGLLDLGNNDLDVQTGSLFNINSQLAQGMGTGSWAGTAGIVSSAAASDPTHLTALSGIQNSVDGTVTGSQLYGSGTALGLFDGTSPANTDVLVKYTYLGDDNLDGSVNGPDYTRIDYGYLSHLTGWFNGDFNYDGVVNGSDYTLIDNAFNTQGAQLSSAARIAATLGSSKSTMATILRSPVGANMEVHRRTVSPGGHGVRADPPIRSSSFQSSGVFDRSPFSSSSITFTQLNCAESDKADIVDRVNHKRRNSSL